MNVASIASNVNSNHMDQVVHFLLSKSERGEIPPETARQRCTAIKQILSPLGPEEPHDIDYVEANLDAIGDRWATLNSNMKGDTAKAYVSRTRASIEDWKAWRKNASGWKFSKRASNPKAKKDESIEQPKASAATGIPESATTPPTTPPAGGKLRTFPIDDERDFSIVLPPGGITVTEARRIAYTLVTLARDFDPGTPTDPFAITRSPS
jgi:hypothetical protein